MPKAGIGPVWVVVQAIYGWDWVADEIKKPSFPCEEMKLRLLFAAAAATAVAFAAPVQAQEDSSSGAYVTVGVGGSWGSNPSTSDTESGTATLGGNNYTYTDSVNGTVNLGGGVAAEAGIGYDWGNNLRTELTYVLNTFGIGTSTQSGSLKWSGNSTSGTNPYDVSSSTSGNLTTNSVFVSGYYDFKQKSNKSKFTPYVGAGLGWTNISLPSLPIKETLTIDGNTYNYSYNSKSGSASAFGYLAKLGVTYAVSEPADLYLEGIYQGATGVTINSVDFGALNSFSARLGVRFRFN